MDHLLLRRLIEQEGSDFQRITNRWRPQNLLMLPQVRIILRDVQEKFTRLSQAEPEFADLDRRHLYITFVRRIRLWVRQAKFTWKSDHMQFLQAITHFYTDYGRILRLLKIDALRGRLTDQPL